MDNKNFPTQDDISDAIHQLITQTPGKYEAMAKNLDPVAGTENALRNRVRQIAGQVVPLGMAVEMEMYSGRSDITAAMCKRAGGVFVKLPDVQQMGNEELLMKFNELLSALGQFASTHNEITADGVLDKDEKNLMQTKGYRVQALVAEIMVVTEMLFGEGDAQSVQLRASDAQLNSVE
ncbi:MAG: YmfL family putative regulatory protein [Rouxiella aceris]|uniref:YmfL family putative regulatory protein n=1 Tax=Rouxiella aceris TaxID=2703884 RepID=UPI00283CE214|nr:YmfL family putative regulatory protein [Rouxiella aceris]MDR3431075.1 YmfL family putative regulatory protein [Rouxiella aceris]